ncbi:hypothetical protein [Plantactinospora sp. GCM10030261]|uniref:hypothetical protein n=1 Tax=Plantactinospora sp. GCM10030261 TaxID=3273420 RepID=UPI00361B7D84
MADPFQKMTDKVREKLAPDAAAGQTADGDDEAELTEGRYLDQVDHGQDQAREQVRHRKGRRAGG